MEQSQVSYPAYSGTPTEHPYVIFPVELLTEEGVTDSVLTPDGKWHRSKSTYATEDPSWPAKALSICEPFHGHFAVLAYCHG
jgi:hypothetical protein